MRALEKPKSPKRSERALRIPAALVVTSLCGAGLLAAAACGSTPEESAQRGPCTSRFEDDGAVVRAGDCRDAESSDTAYVSDVRFPDNFAPI